MFHQMRPSSWVVSLLLLSFILHEAKGIRMEKGVLQGGIRNIQADEKSLTERRNGVLGDVILWREGHRTGTEEQRSVSTARGTRRTLASVTTSTSSATNTAPKNEKTNDGNKANSKLKTSPTNGQEVTVNSPPVSGNRKVTDDHYVDLMDIAEMDYSPAKRKSPIHN
ncbi:hypothetical protein K2173_020647 [Erythroxylum novogranatense]|uniref:Uncharacterized protein n=1 Tax=Erythroxylum novogranatense TaxID=1862640 RepID=A0AAV8TL96_9ROSI|nr:hypothetical protein K2173_020647 [Erythroxylum novogranatense]